MAVSTRRSHRIVIVSHRINAKISKQAFNVVGVAVVTGILEEGLFGASMCVVGEVCEVV